MPSQLYVIYATDQHLNKNTYFSFVLLANFFQRFPGQAGFL